MPLPKKQFADIVDEVILQFTSRPGVKVRITLQIEAETSTSFDGHLQRAVKVNCTVLGIHTPEFEAGEPWQKTTTDFLNRLKPGRR